VSQTATGGDLRGSHGALIVYDVTNNRKYQYYIVLVVFSILLQFSDPDKLIATYNSATTEWNELLTKSCMKASRVLVGNKTDLELQVVSTEIAKVLYSNLICELYSLNNDYNYINFSFITEVLITQWISMVSKKTLKN